MIEVQWMVEDSRIVFKFVAWVCLKKDSWTHNHGTHPLT
jgi:hypothetical protein